MRKAKKAIAVVALGSFVLAGVGCQSGFQRVDGIIDVGSTDKGIYDKEGVFGIGGHHVLNPQTYTGNASNQTPLWDRANDLTNVKAATAARNQLVATMMILSDEAAGRHLSDITGGQVALNTTTGALTMATAGAASLTTGGAASALAVTATGLTGFRGLANEQFYKNTLAPAIVMQVVSIRQLKYEAIQLKLGQLDASQYSVAEAVQDVIDLHEASSAYRAISQIVQDSQTQTENRTAGMKARKEATVQSLHNLQLKRIDKPDSK